MGECDCWALGWGWEVMGLCVAHRSENHQESSREV